MTIKGHVLEKHGILVAAEMMAARQALLAEQLRDLFRRTGREFWPIRMNLHLRKTSRQKCQSGCGATSRSLLDAELYTRTAQTD